MGTVFSHYPTNSSTDPSFNNSLLAMLGVFWQMLEKLFQSDHIENASLSMAACKALSQAIQSSGIANFTFSTCFINSKLH